MPPPAPGGYATPARPALTPLGALGGGGLKPLAGGGAPGGRPGVPAIGGTHQTGLTPSLLQLFIPRPPVEYMPLPAKPKKTQPMTGALACFPDATHLPLHHPPVPQRERRERGKIKKLGDRLVFPLPDSHHSHHFFCFLSYFFSLVFPRARRHGRASAPLSVSVCLSVSLSPLQSLILELHRLRFALQLSNHRQPLSLF